MTPWDDAMAVAARFEAFVKGSAPFSQTDLAILIRDYGIRYSNAELERKRDAQTRDIDELMREQRVWSTTTFGIGLRTLTITNHIRKELGEIEADPHDTREWIDVILLGIDGYWRAGGDNLARDLLAKRAINRARTWPTDQPPDVPVEHVKEGA